MKTILLLLVLSAFGAYSLWVTWEIGYLGIWQAGFANAGSTQVTLDLIIACGIAVVWMVQDAQRMGRNPWPFVAITVVGGSFGPLLYLLLGQWRKAA